MSTLKRKLLTLLLPSLILLLGGELWLNYQALQIAANSAYDRSLLGAIKAIDANISTKTGGLGMELPYTMLEFFQLTASGSVFYRVSTEDGLVTLGNADIPTPSILLQSGVPHFYDALYFGEPVRIGIYARLLSKPLYGANPQRVVIQVAESIDSRTSFARGLLLQAALLDALLVLLIALLLIVGVVLVLRPLQKLRHEVAARAQDDMTPINPAQVPEEVRPLVDAINHHVERYRQLALSQSQFLDDASHQLRTPLAVLRTQIEYAMREPEGPRVSEALAAMQRCIDHATRATNQLLSLARANNAGMAVASMEQLDLNELAEEVGHIFLPEARRKKHDFGFAAAPQKIMIMAIKPLLREAIANLVDNAIGHLAENGMITLAVSGDAATAKVTVTDNGPGMSEEERAHVGERFWRAKGAQAGGTGLGLAIVKTIAELHGGQLTAGAGPDQLGTTMELTFPAVGNDP
ncbi:MAG: sensor histidine kinase [Polaromonas sp.]